MSSLKLAVRTLARSPFLTAVAVLSLALGIGANSAIFSLFDQMLMRALPVQEPDRLVNLGAPGPKYGSQSCNQAGGCDAVFSYPMFRDLERDVGSFSGLASHRVFQTNLAQQDRTLSGEGMLVSGSYFNVLGVRPALGRLIGPSDDGEPGANSVAVLSHRYWERELGADPSVLNQTVIVNGQPMTIIGVAPARFDGTTLGARPDVFVPLTMRAYVEPGWEGLDNRRSYWAYVFGRLAPGVSLERASADMNTTYASLLEELEVPLQEGMSAETLERFRAKQVTVEPGWRGQSSMHGEADTPLKLLLGITGVVLLIACANIANLLLARGAGRSQELAVRSSLGAGRGRLVGQLLTESLLLAVLGGVAALVVARWTLALVGGILPPETAGRLELTLSPQMVGFTALVAVVTGVLFGLYPALHSTRGDLVTGLKSIAGQPSGNRAAARFRSGLVTAQIALSMALLVAAGLFIKSLANISRVDLGLEPDRIVTFNVSPQLNGYEPERSLAFFEDLERELAALPGVTGVTASMIPVVSGSSWGTDVMVEGFESGPDIDSNSRLNVVGAEFLSVLGMPLVAGREFTSADVAGASKVALVNEAFTRKFGLEGRDAVGRFMGSGREGELDTEIVGVMQDAAYANVKDDVPPLFITPYRQREGIGALAFYVRGSLDTNQLMLAIPPIVKGLDPSLPVEDLKSLNRQIEENVYLDRVISILSAAFAVLATLLAAVGLYGVLAYTVALRTREIGLRMALGARSGQVRGMILRQVTRMTVIGGFLGIGAALFLGRYAESLLFGMEGRDPAVVVAVGVLLGLVAMGAGYVPALRASRVDPMEALRYE